MVSIRNLKNSNSHWNWSNTISLFIQSIQVVFFTSLTYTMYFSKVNSFLTCKLSSWFTSLQTGALFAILFVSGLLCSSYHMTLIALGIFVKEKNITLISDQNEVLSHKDSLEIEKNIEKNRCYLQHSNSCAASWKGALSRKTIKQNGGGKLK